MSGDCRSDGRPDAAESSAFSGIVGRVRPGGTLLRHWRLGGGVSANVHCLEVSHEGQLEHLVVRRHREHDWKPASDDVTEAEFSLLRVLHEAGLPVPAPLHLDASNELLPSPFFVMPMVAGTTTIREGFLGSALAQMAEFLTRLHRLPIAGTPPLPSREDPVSGALEYLPETEEWQQVRAELALLSAKQGPPRLLHGDFWPGNVIWAENRLAAVVDWEDAALGSPASDVACCRAELNVMFDRKASEAFLQLYQERSQQEVLDLALWELYVSSAALATMHEWGLPLEVEEQRRERTLAFAMRAAEAMAA